MLNLLTFVSFLSLGLSNAEIDTYDCSPKDAIKNTFFKSGDFFSSHDNTCQLQVQSESFSNKENDKPFQLCAVFESQLGSEI